MRMGISGVSVFLSVYLSVHGDIDSKLMKIGQRSFYHRVAQGFLTTLIP